MSRLTHAHHEIANLLRWHVTEIASNRNVSMDDIIINGSVQSYHRKDRYREIDIDAPNKKVLEELKLEVEKRLYARGVKARVFWDFISSKRLTVSIWPE